CAGGGGKTLALAAEMQGSGQIYAHDANPSRMKDLPERARRAGADIQVISPEHIESSPKCDLVLVDAPCSGSGTWRRAPDAKWRLTPERLAELKALQQSILQDAAQLVRPGGWLAYATCSLLAGENTAQIAAFLAANPSWQCKDEMRLVPGSEGDGFYLAVIQRGT
ncbi:MAG: RsmB/NOP family class I SAM-dependent RNA methyltransferase, partial [Rhodobacteraceae bacterium]|nr:RsmB/NOP family class I SAM-dependent RNA methyltransferase [Paracoccaceae bacterium]